MRDAIEILNQALQDGLSEEDLALALRKIKEDRSEEDPQLKFWIQIVGLSEATENRKTIEKFLYLPKNPEAAVCALYVLIGWGFGKEYLNEMKAFLKGVSWDTHDHLLQNEAILCSGFYLRNEDDKALLQLLLDRYMEDPFRMKAYWALADAMGESRVGIRELEGMEIQAGDDPLAILNLVKVELNRSEDHINTEKLWNKLRAGDLSQNEFKILIENVKRNGLLKITDSYSFIKLLKRVDPELTKEIRPSLEKLLEEADYSEQILTLFCRDWNLTADYLETIKQFICRVDKPREIAVILAGKYLKDHFDEELLHLLLKIYQNDGSLPEADPQLQACAYHALLEATGREYDPMDSFEIEKYLLAKRFDLLDESAIREVYDRLQLPYDNRPPKVGFNQYDYLRLLVAKSDLGTISNEEVALAKEKLKSCNEYELSDWIHIVGNAKAYECRKEVERGIYSGKAVREALRVLCLQFGLTEEYLEDLKRFIHNDFEGSQYVAIEIAGQFLREHRDKELLQLLLEVFENPKKFDKRKTSLSLDGIASWDRLKYYAFAALANASGQEETSEIQEIVNQVKLRIQNGG